MTDRRKTTEPRLGDGRRMTGRWVGWAAVLVTAAADKPRVAVFPLAGTAPADQRQAVGFSLRSKLDRDGHYDPIDGPTMDELSADRTPGLATPPAELAALARAESPAVLIWGEVDGDVTTAAGATLHLKVFDGREKAAVPHAVDQPLHHPTDLRFAVENVLGTLAGVGPFSHPVEQPVVDDPAAAALWKSNPNLMPDGDFAKSGPWTAVLRADKYVVPVRDAMPDTDRVEILRHPDGRGGLTNVLAMTLSKNVAESNGLACLSAPIPVHADGRYRLSFRYRSDGPHLHVFVKGYVPGTDLAGQPADVQCYELQVPPSGPTGGKWQAVTADLNPQNPAGPPPATLKVDLYAYLSPGTAMFADVQLKDVGRPTRRAADDAPPPAGHPPVMFTADTVTVITAATGHRHLGRCAASVAGQTFTGVRHWVVVDGRDREPAVRAAVAGSAAAVVVLPEPTGLQNWNGHRIYAAASLLANTEFVCFLDEDNWFDPDHVGSLVAAVRRGRGRWAFALRKIVDGDGAVVTLDQCESLGSLHGPFSAPADVHVDANCYLIGRELAAAVAPSWYCPTRPGDGRPEPDRAVARLLTSRFGPGCTNGRHTVNYTAGNRPDSVPAAFFIYGNRVLRDRYPGGLPWERG